MFKTRKRKAAMRLTLRICDQSLFSSRSDCTLTVSSSTYEDSEYRGTFVGVHKDMLRNLHNKDDIIYVMQPTRNLMLFMGIWPSRSKKRSIFRTIYDFILILSSNILFATEFIPGFIYWLLEDSADRRIRMSAILLYAFMSAVQYDIILSRNSKIRQCWKHVEEDWENVFSIDAWNIMFECAKNARFLIMICGTLMYCGSFMIRVILPLSKEDIVTDENVTIRPFACPVNFLFIDAQASPFYEIVLVCQAVSGIIIGAITTSTYGLLACFVEHANGQMKILIGLMKDLVNKQWQKEEEVDQKLAHIVEHHIRVNSFLQMVQYTLQEICLIEILVNTLAICLLVYFVLLDWHTGNFGIIGTYILNIFNVTIHIFLFCYTGEQLNEQTEKVAIESRELEWYLLPERKMRSVIMLMTMSNYPPKIYAGKIMELSLKTFGDIIKTSGAYFNILRNVAK